MVDGSFHVLRGPTIRGLLDGNRSSVIEVVQDAYSLHARGHSLNPNSYFLRFPDKPDARIIALPAYLGGDFDSAGIKWISSFPGNHERGLPRASAVLILNDYCTGVPIACIEGSIISAHRTAAFAALAAAKLSSSKNSAKTAIIGTGPIARHVLDYLLTSGWDPGRVCLYDLRSEAVIRFKDDLSERWNVVAECASDIRACCKGADLVVFATTASKPHVFERSIFAAAPTILHVSLRDIAPGIILQSQNFTDDTDHCLQANTSLHLAEQEVGSRSFVAGTLTDAIDERVELDFSRPRIFSPFGLGMLDIALGVYTLKEALSTQSAISVENFFEKALA